MASTSTASSAATTAAEPRGRPRPEAGDGPAATAGPAVAYLAPRLPALSETFVYREVRALRGRGWRVPAVSLNRPEVGDEPALADLTAGGLVVYGRGKGRLLAAAAAEFARRPLRSLGTLATALGDAVAPGEPLAPAGRLKLLGQAAAGLALARALRPAGVGHVHCHFAHAPATVGMYAARQLGVPFSFTGHANDLFRRRALLRRKLARAAFVACISEWHRDLYRSIRPDPAGKYRVVRCGVDVASWAPREASRSSEGGPIRVLTVCRLVEKKGIDTLLRGLAESRSRHGIDARLVVAGDGPLRARLKSLARELGCGDRVEWLGDVDNDRVRRLMDEADLFALPCRPDAEGDRDGIPVALMEAMACGLPVVAGDLPAVRELVRDGETGLLISGADPDALAGHLARLANEPGLRARLGEAGRARVEAEFSLEANVSRLEEAFRGCRRGAEAS